MLAIKAREAKEKKRRDAIALVKKLREEKERKKKLE